jgi:anthranilate phosphoribosyltransferase
MSSKLFVPYVQAVGRGEKLKRDLSYDEAVEALRLILQRRATDAQIGAFLIAQRVKGESVDEIRGFTQVVRNEFMRPISPRVENLLDLAVPYDGKVKTAQLAPAIAILLAEAGVPVLLHGDEGVPTKEGIGPGQLFAELGMATDQEPGQVKRMVEAVGVGYLAAKQFVPAWHQLTPLRREFGLRTALNSIEKLFNPGHAPYQVSGFYHGNYIERLRITQTGERASWMAQGEEGSVEMAAGRRSHIYAVDEANDVILEPAEVGLPQRERIEVAPSVAAHGQINASVLAGQPGPATDQAVLTSAAILALLGAAPDLATGMARLRHLLANGSVQDRLERIRNFR